MVKDLRQQLVAACKAHEVAHAALKRPGGSHRHCRTLQQPCNNRATTVGYEPPVHDALNQLTMKHLDKPVAWQQTHYS